MAKERAQDAEVQKFLPAEASVSVAQPGNPLAGLFKKEPSVKRESTKNARLEAAAALKADFKRLNLDERLSVVL